MEQAQLGLFRWCQVDGVLSGVVLMDGSHGGFQRSV